MRQWLGVTDTPAEWTGAVVTFGAFDGVHLGHRRTVSAAVELARRLDRPAVVAAYEQPAEPAESAEAGEGRRPPRLTSPRHTAELLAGLGVDGLCVLPADEQADAMPAAEFAGRVLTGLRAGAVVAGADLRTGRNAVDLTGLGALGGDLGFDVHPVALVEAPDGEVVTSDRIRARVAAGDVAAAAAQLGRDHRVEGTVVHGADRGASQLGFPTANVDSPGHPAVPADGVYAGHLVVRGTALPAAVSVGTNPTFDGVDRTVEAYVLDFSGDLYGEAVGVEFRARVRGQERFDSVEALIARMTADVEAIRRVLGQVTAVDRDA